MVSSVRSNPDCEMTTKTSTRHLGLRFAFLLLALLQVAGPVSYQTADLMLEAQGLATPLHVEGEGNEECALHHDDVMCQTVRSLADAVHSRVASPGAVATALPPLIQVRLSELPAFGRVELGAVGSRAPPLA
jgi:alkyl hydroperoxide reductase subunit AhpF